MRSGLAAVVAFQHLRNPMETDPDSFIQLIQRFATKRLLIVGDIMLDRYVLGRVERLNPEAPVPILHAKSGHRFTGGAGNTAKNAVSLGATTTLVSVVGLDQAADDIATAARQEGYEAVLVRDPSRPSIEKRRYIVGSQQMLRVDYEETHPVSGGIESELIAAITTASAKADAIIVSDYAKGVITRRIAETIMAAARSEGVPVMADVKPSHIEFFRGANFISPNRKEAHEYLGLNQHLQGGLPKEELGARLHETFQTAVFLTLSEDGMFILNDQTPGTHVPQTHRVEVADTSGCGDTAAVAITLAKICGASDIQAAQIGNAAGAVIASKIGAVALSRRELIEMLVESKAAVPG